MRTLASLLAAVVAAGLWLLWGFEHDETGVRAPWTGLTLTASAVGFVVVGIVGRGWRALLFAMAASAAAVGLVEPLIWDPEVSQPVVDESCDPGCISLAAAVVMASIMAAALATLGIVVRRGVALANA